MYNLGFQAKAQPFRELEEAHKNFRLSISQRMLYDDQQSKKRTALHLNDQRQQITALKPPTAAGANADNGVRQNERECSPVYASGRPCTPLAKKFRPYREEEWTRTGRRVDEEWTKTGRKVDECNGNAAAAMPSNEASAFNGHADATAAMNMQTNNNNSTACAIASSLNSVYGDSHDGNAYDYNGDVTDLTNTSAPQYVTALSDSIVLSDTEDCGADGINIPPNFIRSAKNHHEPWMGALFLDEPDVNKICKYPRHLVYPGNGSEYSLEEIRARNYTTIIEAIKERNRQREQTLAEQHRIEQMRRAANQEEQARIRMEREKMERMQKAAAAAAAEEERNRQAALAMQRAAKAAEVERLRLAAFATHSSSFATHPTTFATHSTPYAAHPTTFATLQPQSDQNLSYGSHHHSSSPTVVPALQGRRMDDGWTTNHPPHGWSTNHPPHGWTTNHPPHGWTTNHPQQQQVPPAPPTMQYQTPIVQQQPLPPPQPPTPTMQYEQHLSAAPPIQNEPNNSLVNNVNHFEDDIEEQIEASTILLDNGQSKPQKITIKFRKERSGVTATSSFSNTVPSPVASPSAIKTPKQKKKKKRCAGKTAMKAEIIADEDESSQLLPPMLTSSNDSYSSATSAKGTAKSKTKSSTRTKFEFGRDSAPNQSWEAEFDDSDDENSSTNGTATKGSARFTFTGVASTPIRSNNNGRWMEINSNGNEF